jgi:hypothetical protein
MSKCLNENDFKEIRSFVYRNARPLEIALWKYHFEKGHMGFGCTNTTWMPFTLEERGAIRKYATYA